MPDRHKLPRHRTARGSADQARWSSYSMRLDDVAAVAPLPCVRGLVFFAFPLHPAGKPFDDHATHLAEVKISMLFVQGTRDRLADMQRLRPVLAALGSRATPLLLEESDHSFHAPTSTERRDPEILADVLD